MQLYHVVVGNYVPKVGQPAHEEPTSIHSSTEERETTYYPSIPNKEDESVQVKAFLR